MNYVLLILVYTVLDYAWAQYTIEVGRKRAVRAGLWAILLYLMGILGTIAWLSDKRYIISICIGSFLGTFLAVKKGHK